MKIWLVERKDAPKRGEVRVAVVRANSALGARLALGFAYPTRQWTRSTCTAQELDGHGAPGIIAVGKRPTIEKEN